MSRGAITFSEKVEYYTPKYIVDKFGSFDYDPATTKEQAERLGIPDYDTEETNGLLRDWTKYDRIWINPPFTLKKEFLKKAIDTLRKVDVEQDTYISIYILLPISFLTTKGFADLMADVDYDLYLPNGRIKFENAEGDSRSPAFGSVIINLTFSGEKRIVPLEI